MSKRRFIQRVVETEDDIHRALPWADHFLRKALPGGPAMIRLMRPQRTGEQNAHLHPIGRALAQHLERHGAHRMTEKQWRMYFVDVCFGQERVPDPLGRPCLVGIGLKDGTSGLDVEECGEYIEWVYATGVEVGVDWCGEHKSALETAREKQADAEARHARSAAKKAKADGGDRESDGGG